MSPADRKKIASLYRGHWNRNYAASKLRTDPLYQAVAGHLRGSNLPLLDLGCGLGLLAFFLRSEGFQMPVHGVDYDVRKIEAADLAATTAATDGISFATCDLRAGLPDHSGNITILDILQFFEPGDQARLLEAAVRRLAPGGKLIIRSGLRDETMRFKITVLGDLLAKATFWMKSGPVHYPTAADFQRILAPFGKVTISPLWGGTPFNNHLIVLTRSEAA